MRANVCLQPVQLAIGSIALGEVAFMRFIDGMHFQMTPQMCATHKPLLAVRTFKRFVIRLYMILISTLTLKRVNYAAANNPYMYLLMLQQSENIIECLPAFHEMKAAVPL